MTKFKDLFGWGEMEWNKGKKLEFEENMHGMKTMEFFFCEIGWHKKLKEEIQISRRGLQKASSFLPGKTCRVNLVL